METVMVSFSHAEDRHKESIVEYGRQVFSFAFDHTNFIQEPVKVVSGIDIINNRIIDHIITTPLYKHWTLKEGTKVRYRQPETFVDIYTSDSIYVKYFSDKAISEVRDFNNKKDRSFVIIKSSKEETGEKLSEELTLMRNLLVSQANIFFVAGGKTSGYMGSKPGIQEELEFILDKIRNTDPNYQVLRLYLDVSFGGVVELLKPEIQEEFSNNPYVYLYGVNKSSNDSHIIPAMHHENIVNGDSPRTLRHTIMFVQGEAD